MVLKFSYKVLLSSKLELNENKRELSSFLLSFFL